MAYKLFQQICISFRHNNRCMSNVTDTKGFEKFLNYVQLLGRVGNNPHMAGTDERPVFVFYLATKLPYKTDSVLSPPVQERIDWHCIAVNKPGLRENVKNYIKKGKRVLVNGRIAYTELKDKDTEKTKFVTNIVADEIIFLEN